MKDDRFTNYSAEVKLEFLREIVGEKVNAIKANTTAIRSYLDPSIDISVSSEEKLLILLDYILKVCEELEEANKLLN